MRFRYSAKKKATAALASSTETLSTRRVPRVQIQVFWVFFAPKVLLRAFDPLKFWQTISDQLREQV